VKDYYSLLSVEAGATADDIKRAFRREIARYHPDKVHHLGAEFQALAAERAAELTEAYRVLMDMGLRSAYDRERGGEPAGAPAGPAASGATVEPAPANPSEPRVEKPAAAPPPASEPAPRADAPQQASRDTFVRRMSMTRFRDAIQQALDGATSMPARGFEASYLVKGKRSLFGKTPPERLLTAYVGQITPDEIAKLGQDAIAARGTAELVTVFALGDRLAPAGELSAAVVALRRRAPAGVTVFVVPVDVRDWSALMPRDASASARAVIARLTAKD
jgi:curved DNA-binding protein CbpA